MQTTGGSPDGRLLHNRLNDDDRGAVAVLVAASMILLLGFAALAIDIGAGYNERRADQTASDTGVMSGAVYVANGNSAMRTAILDIARQNLPNTYSNAEWQTMWENCVDPAADSNSLFPGANFVAIPRTEWVGAGGLGQLVHLRAVGRRMAAGETPSATDRHFLRPVSLGVNQLGTDAFAVAKLNFGGGAGGVFSLWPHSRGGGPRLLVVRPERQRCRPLRRGHDRQLWHAARVSEVRQPRTGYNHDWCNPNPGNRPCPEHRPRIRPHHHGAPRQPLGKHRERGGVLMSPSPRIATRSRTR